MANNQLLQLQRMPRIQQDDLEQQDLPEEQSLEELFEQLDFVIRSLKNTTNIINRYRERNQVIPLHISQDLNILPRKIEDIHRAINRKQLGLRQLPMDNNKYLKYKNKYLQLKKKEFF